MNENNDRIQQALAEYLDYLELGGSQPDTSYLSPAEQKELEDLINALDLTEGVAFGLSREPSTVPAAAARGEPSETGRNLVASLRAALPGDVGIDADPAAIVSRVGDVEVIDAWLVGTFGGRVRVWLLAIESAQELEANTDYLEDIGRAFGMMPDTTAFALVAADLSCLVVQPEDCAPKIHIPSGSLISRSYRQPIRPADEAITEFLNELIPYWDPVPAFDASAPLTIDVSAVGKEFVNAAIENQRGIGGRARKGNPKKDVLLALGDKEISGLTKLIDGLLDGSIDSEETESRIEGLAQSP
jgi:hypothetical protein